MGILQNMLSKAIKPLIDDAFQQNNGAAFGAKPDTFDVPINMQMGFPFSGFTNRKDAMSVSFETLRVFSVNYDVARACINHRKRQIQNLDWVILPKDEKVNPDKYKKQIDEITKFFLRPAYMNDFSIFIEKIIEDMLVFDAIVLWKDKTYSGQLMELLPIDAATIRIRVTEDGSIPEAPEVAYQQIIKGVLAGEWDTEQMIYNIMNPRNSTPYGLGPLESMILGVDSALKAQMYNSNMLSEGSVPEGFVSLPTTWTPDQIKTYQMWFDSLMAGNSKFNSRIKFLPGGQGVGYYPTKKPEDMRYLEFEKWLLMKCCALFDVQPSDIGFLENATYNNSEGQKQAGLQRGLIPTALFIKRMFTKIINEDFEAPDLKFEWLGLQVTDDSFELDKDKAYLPMGVLTIDEIRNKQGLEPFGLPYTQKPFVMSNGTPILLEDADKPVEAAPTDPANQDPQPVNDNEGNEDDQSVEEMDKWESKCLNALKRGKKIPEFHTDKIDNTIQTLVKMKLMIANSKEDVKEAFRPFKERMRENMLIGKALKLKEDISSHTRKINDKA